MIRCSLAAVMVMTVSTLGCVAPSSDPGVPPAPAFADVTVHDPAVIREGGTYYIVGSHLAGAKSDDLIRWTKIDQGVRNENRIIPNVRTEMREAFEWGQTDTFWAGALVKLRDGRFYHYYSVCKGDSPRGAIGLAVSDRPEGPYRNLGLLLRSGMWGQPSEDGTTYDATVHPNAVDPDVFYAPDGKLWMIYGSYSGGIFAMRLDPDTGRPLPGQGYGKKLMGGNHARIEAPAILYHPGHKYYYLFLSFGGLGSDGGYQLRVARSRNPDGPYVDAGGRDMIDAKGPKGSFFDDKAIEPFGLKLLGNFEWATPSAATTQTAPEPIGYVSPGHNTCVYDAETGRSFLIFHTRFPRRGEQHQVRVHQLLFTPDAWPVMAPHRYAGESPAKVSRDDLIGTYELIDHGRRITTDIVRPVAVRLQPDGTLAGDRAGTWKLSGDHTVTLAVGGKTYTGAALRQWHAGRKAWVMTFSVISSDGVSLWGSAAAPTARP